jgi:hypothetical protein
MKRRHVHLARTHDVFLDWYRDQDTSPSGLHFAQHVEEFAVTLKKAQYCCACGKRMQVGERAYRALVSWGRHMSEGALRPHHTSPCIPAYEFIFTMSDGEEYTFSTWALNKAWVDSIGEPNVRTRDDAFAWAEWCAGYFENEVNGWQSFVIKEDGEVVREEQFDIYEQRVAHGEAFCQQISPSQREPYTPQHVAAMYNVSVATASEWMGIETYADIFRDDW